MADNAIIGLATPDAKRQNMLTVREAAMYLGVSKSTIYKLTMHKTIPHYKPFGEKIYFDKSELDTWLHRNKVYSGAELNQSAMEYCNGRRLTACRRRDNVKTR